MTSPIPHMPNNHEPNEDYQPSFPVLWLRKDGTVQRTKVKSIALDVKTRKPLFFLEECDDPVSAEYLRLNNFSNSNSDNNAVDPTTTTTRMSDKTCSLIKQEPTVAVVAMQQQQLIAVSKESLEIVSEALVLQNSKSSGSIPVESHEVNARGCQTSLTTYLVIPKWITCEHVEDVVDEDTIKDILYSTGCSSIDITYDSLLQIAVTGSQQSFMEKATRRLKAILLESVENDHDVERLRQDLTTCNDLMNSKNQHIAAESSPQYRSFESGTTDRAATEGEYPYDDDECQPKSKKQKVPHLAAAHDERMNHASEALANKMYPTDSLSREIHVPAWAGNLFEIADKLRVILPWLEGRLSCKIFMETRPDALLICVESRNQSNLDTASEAVENFMFCRVQKSHQGRLLYHFANQLVELPVIKGEIRALPQRDPNDVGKIVHGAVIPLPRSCERAELCAKGVLNGLMRESGCSYSAVGCEDDQNDPFVFLHAVNEKSVVAGCGIILGRIKGCGDHTGWSVRGRGT